MGNRDRSINSEQLEFECQLKTPTRSRIQELLILGTSSPLFQSLIANQDLLRLALSMDAIKRCLANMLADLDRDTPQTKVGMALSLACTE